MIFVRCILRPWDCSSWLIFRRVGVRKRDLQFSIFGAVVVPLLKYAFRPTHTALPLLKHASIQPHIQSTQHSALNIAQHLIFWTRFGVVVVDANGLTYLHVENAKRRTQKRLIIVVHATWSLRLVALTPKTQSTITALPRSVIGSFPLPLRFIQGSIAIYQAHKQHSDLHYNPRLDSDVSIKGGLCSRPIRRESTWEERAEMFSR